MTAPVREGDLLAGKYRVERVLGVGGMGVVVAAHHIDLDEKVAIKFLLPETLGNSEAVARFAREARAAVKIKSEHVARVTDVGKLENGSPYMVMEYLEGGDLSTWLGQRGALPIEQAVEFILHACEAMAEAHGLGIVHRDLKPANLFVIRRPDGMLSVKVLDFGISKTTSLTGSGNDASMTKTSALMGSPLYMSPEQMQSSKDVDARSDIWTIGVILYELVAGTTPFTGDTMPELILQIMSAAPQPVRNKRPDAPDGLEEVILRCLDKDRGKRFESVGELALALLPFAPKRSKASVERISGVMRAAGFSGSALALPPSSSADERPAAAATAASWGRTTTGKSRGQWMIGGVGAAVVIGTIAMFLRMPAASKEATGSSEPAPSPGLVATRAAAPSSATAPPTTAAPVTTGIDEATPAPSAPLAAIAPVAVDRPVGSGGRRDETRSRRSPRSNPETKPPGARPVAVAPAPAAPVPAVSHATTAPAKTSNMYDDRK